MVRRETGDTRVVYGFHCAWWGGIEDVGPHHSKHPGLPGCPHCGNGLMEVESPEVWWSGVEKYEKNGHPGYRAFIEWRRGKCFKDLETAAEVYNAKPGRRVEL